MLQSRSAITRARRSARRQITDPTAERWATITSIVLTLLFASFGVAAAMVTP